MRRFVTLSALIGFMAAAILPAVQPSAQDVAPETAAPAAPDAGSQVFDEVIVRGRRLSEIEDDLRIVIGEFIGEVAKPSLGRGLARWNRRVCVGVANLENTAAQYLVDRISALVVEVGLPPGEPGCAPDVIVLFTTDGASAAEMMVDAQPRLFRPSGNLGGTNLGRQALDEFQESERAVRWWHVSMPVDARTGVAAIRTNSSPSEAAPTINVAGPSRIHSGISDDLERVIIVVDSRRLTGTTWQQLGDYLAFVALAQIDQDADPGAFDSILNLFSNPKAYSGLTDWDRSYVHALYEYDQERTAHLQTGEIVSKMAQRELERTQ
jgi:hypothetical protein